MKTHKYLLILYLVIITLANVNAINLSAINCNQIKQCDKYGTSFSGANIVCNNADQDSPDTEEITVTDVGISDVCQIGDDSSDCFSIGLDFYETLNSGDVYHGSGYDRFGGVTFCCDFGENTAFRTGLVNDFNSDRSNPITRDWAIIDSNDNYLEVCPTDTYNPVDITQTNDLSTFNISFKPFGRNYDQWVEPQFDVATIWNIQDYFLQNVSTTYNYADQIKEYIQADAGVFTWDIYDLFTFAEETHLFTVFVNDISYIKDSCQPYKLLGCTDSSSTSFSCTAGTGVNVLDDMEAFLEAFFEKYKTPLAMQLGHEWCFGSSLSDCFTGYYYWETAYGIDSGDILTYQGMRQYTTRTLSRIQSDWAINDFEGNFVVCENDADIRIGMIEESELSTYETYPYNVALNEYSLIKNESYKWTVYNDELDVVTSDPLFRFDWTNDGVWDINWNDQIEGEGDILASTIDTSSSTSVTVMDAETWGKGGKDSETTNYRVYDNPLINWEVETTKSAPLGTPIVYDVFDGNYYDIGRLDYYCIDWTNDGVANEIYRRNSFITYSCTTNGSTILYNDANLLDNNIEIYSEYVGDVPGSYTMNVTGGINLVYRDNYTRSLLVNYQYTIPDTEPVFVLKSSSWYTYRGDIIQFNVEDTISEASINAVCYDRDYTDSNFDFCYSVDGSGYCGFGSCTVNTNPHEVNENIVYSDVNDYNNNVVRVRVTDEFGYFAERNQVFSFREPIISINITDISGRNNILFTEDIIFNFNNSTSENPIYNICVDYTNNGIDNSCNSNIQYNFTIQYSDVNSFNTQTMKVTITDDEGFFENKYYNYNFRDYIVEAQIKRVAGSISIGNVINETGWLLYDLSESVVEPNASYVCYDYTNNGEYNKCYSSSIGDNKCGIACDFTPSPLEGTINISYSEVNEFGTFELKGLVSNGINNATNLKQYSIFIDSPDSFYLPKITSTNNDDDINDDFVIDVRDNPNLDDVSEEKVWYFEWTTLFSDYLSEPTYSCWGNSITGAIDACYQQGGGYNYVCELNCSDSPWFSPYTVNSTLNYESNKKYVVTAIIGDSNTGIANIVANEFRFNPMVQQDVYNIKFFLVVSIILMLFIAVFIVIFILFQGVIVSFLIGLIGRKIVKIFNKKR